MRWSLVLKGFSVPLLRAPYWFSSALAQATDLWGWEGRWETPCSDIAPPRATALFRLLLLWLGAPPFNVVYSTHWWCLCSMSPLLLLMCLLHFFPIKFEQKHHMLLQVVEILVCGGLSSLVSSGSHSGQFVAFSFTGHSPWPSGNKTLQNTGSAPLSVIIICDSANNVNGS